MAQKLFGKDDNPGCGCGKQTFPAEAHEWRLQHLENLGICYSEKSLSLTEIMSLLKSEGGRSRLSGGENDRFPDIILEIIQFMKTIWTFSFDVNECEYGCEFRRVQDYLRRMKRDFSTNEDDFRTQHIDLLKERANFRIFNAWCTKMADFLSWWDVFLRIVREEATTEASFSQLFLQFSMICLLVPEMGESFKSQMSIKGVDVSGLPDVRFSRFSMNDSSNTVECVTRAEVKGHGVAKKKYQNPENESFSIHKELPSAVLGQHGIELLLETKRSFFKPNVSGMICAGTKVIFTYLDMGIDHLKIIKGRLDEIDDEYQNQRSTIYYSRPYDFMDVTDRSEILETFFWLGYVQSSQFEIYRS